MTTLADRIEAVLWGRRDVLAAAQGWQITRLSRWRRRYRHPRLAIALAARAARAHADATYPARSVPRDTHRPERAA